MGGEKKHKLIKVLGESTERRILEKNLERTKENFKQVKADRRFYEARATLAEMELEDVRAQLEAAQFALEARERMDRPPEVEEVLIQHAAVEKDLRERITKAEHQNNMLQIKFNQADSIAKEKTMEFTNMREQLNEVQWQLRAARAEHTNTIDSYEAQLQEAEVLREQQKQFANRRFEALKVTIEYLVKVKHKPMSRAQLEEAGLDPDMDLSRITWSGGAEGGMDPWFQDQLAQFEDTVIRQEDELTHWRTHTHRIFQDSRERVQKAVDALLQERSSAQIQIQAIREILTEAQEAATDAQLLMQDSSKDTEKVGKALAIISQRQEEELKSLALGPDQGEEMEEEEGELAGALPEFEGPRPKSSPFEGELGKVANLMHVAHALRVKTAPGSKRFAAIAKNQEDHWEGYVACHQVRKCLEALETALVEAEESDVGALTAAAAGFKRSHALETALNQTQTAMALLESFHRMPNPLSPKTSQIQDSPTSRSSSMPFIFASATAVSRMKSSSASSSPRGPPSQNSSPRRKGSVLPDHLHPAAKPAPEMPKPASASSLNLNLNLNLPLQPTPPPKKDRVDTPPRPNSSRGASPVGMSLENVQRSLLPHQSRKMSREETIEELRNFVANNSPRSERKGSRAGVVSRGSNLRPTAGEGGAAVSFSSPRGVGLQRRTTPSPSMHLTVPESFAKIQDMDPEDMELNQVAELSLMSNNAINRAVRDSERVLEALLRCLTNAQPGPGRVSTPELSSLTRFTEDFHYVPKPREEEAAGSSSTAGGGGGGGGGFIKEALEEAERRHSMELKELEQQRKEEEWENEKRDEVKLPNIEDRVSSHTRGPAVRFIAGVPIDDETNILIDPTSSYHSQSSKQAGSSTRGPRYSNDNGKVSKVRLHPVFKDTLPPPPPPPLAAGDSFKDRHSMHHQPRFAGDDSGGPVSPKHRKEWDVGGRGIGAGESRTREPSPNKMSREGKMRESKSAVSRSADAGNSFKFTTQSFAVSSASNFDLNDMALKSKKAFKSKDGNVSQSFKRSANAYGLPGIGLDRPPRFSSPVNKQVRQPVMKF